MASLASFIPKKIKKFLGKYIKIKVRDYKLYQQLFEHKIGIEIGGPSVFFIDKAPIYDKIKSLDGVNFSTSTVWEGALKEGNNYQYGNKIGYQYICDAVDLSGIESGKYDFVLSCNNLEHIANPFKAITEWLRVIKDDGLIFLVLPNKNNNFDHKRSITKFEHLLDDYQQNTSEKDLTHLEEILELHDLSMDPPAGDLESFRKRSLQNFENRCLHHHVYDVSLLEQIFQYFNIDTLSSETIKTDHIIVGRKK